MKVISNLRGLATAVTALLLVLHNSAPAAGLPLPRSTPEAQGVSSKAILDFVEAADRINTLHSFMILRHGRVIAEGWWNPEAPDKPHVLASLSKSFNATAVGLAIHEGKLSLDDPVLKFFPADAPAELSENLKAMKVRDLLTMSCGHDTEPKIVGGAPTVKQFLAHPVPHKPGTHFQYNTLGSYVLSAIVTKATGQTSLEYLKPRLFAPLGIESPQWESSPEGNSLGGYGLKLCTEDIAKFGQLYLQKGKWNGKQLIPQAWIEQATSRQVPNEEESHAKIGIDWQQGYGFQFWRCTHNAFRGDGAGGQLCVVIPDRDVVVAITAQTGDFQKELNAVWDNLLPASRDQVLPEDAASQEQLRQALSKLVAHPEKKANSSPLPGKGLAQHDFFYAGEAKEENMYIIKGGRIAWSYTHPGRGEISDAILLPNNNVLFAHQFGITEVTADKRVAWNYDAPPNTEIHTAQPFGTDSVWFVQNGDPAKFVIVNQTSGKTEREFVLPVKNPKGVHGQFRQARMTAAGTVLVAHMDLGKAVEYDLTGKALWSTEVPGIWSAKPLPNGNILATSNRGLVREINRQGQTVWEWTPADAPDYPMTSLQTASRLANGNTIINNWFNQWSNSKLDRANPPVQAIEVNREKEVVWVLRSWTPPEDLGPSTTIQLLDEPKSP